MAGSRRKSRVVQVGGLSIGGGHPVVVQSMTDTDTADIEATTAQALLLARAGSELVRITVDRSEAARAVPEIRARLRDAGCGVPLVGDFHFIGHRLLREHPRCAEALDKLRINPGNVGRGRQRDEHFAAFIGIARDQGKAVRIGVNAGSLDPELLARKMDANAARERPLDAEAVKREALVESALASTEEALRLGLGANRIIVSCKVSRLPQMVAVYRELAARLETPLHLGLTEAGIGNRGVVATTAALAVLLEAGIGDTIRASLTPDVGGDRAREVRLCQEILQALELRAYRPSVTACPGCGRTTSTLFRKLAREVTAALEKRRPAWRRSCPGSEALKVAVMGCVVNGPGESRAADIGISLPGGREEPRAPVYVDGERLTFLEGPSIAAEFLDLVETYVRKRWGNGKQA